MLNIIPLLTSPSDRISEGVFYQFHHPTLYARMVSLSLSSAIAFFISLYLTFLPESEPFEQEVIIDIVFPGNTGNRGSWLQNQFNHLKFNSFENDLRGSADNVFAP